MRLKLSSGAGQTTLVRRATKSRIRALSFALPLALVPLAQANAATITVFDSSNTTWTAASQYSSPNPDGTTTFATKNDPVVPGSGGSWTNQGTDYFNLGSSVHTGSGIWALTATVQQNLGSGLQERAMDLGFGNFTSTSVLQAAVLANTGGPFLVDNQGPASQMNVSHGGFFFSNASGSLLNGLYRADASVNPTITEGAKATYQIILNTNGPAWTLQFDVNGIAMKFNQYAADGTTVIAPDLTTLTYGPNTPTINGIGISVANFTGDTTVFSETLTDTTVTSAVPEPSTWAMMVLGFAGLGLLSYRRTRRNGGLNLRFA